MASPVEAAGEFVTPPALDPRGGRVWAVLESPPESAVDRSSPEADETPRLHEVGDLRRDEVPWELDRKLAALCREQGPLRAVLARVADRLVSIRAWERLGYARLSDYAVECLGLSARSVRCLAQVGLKWHTFPSLEEALVSGALGWTKVRLLSRLPVDEDIEAWITHARRVTAEELSREVRKVDRGSIEAGAAGDEGARSGLFEVRCSPEVRWKWNTARGAARRAAGRMLHPAEAAELIAAEVLSALPIDEKAAETLNEKAAAAAEDGVRHPSCVEDEAPRREGAGPEFSEVVLESRKGADTAVTTVRPSRRPRKAESAPEGTASSLPRRSCSSLPGASLPLPLRHLLEGLEEADAFEVDLRFRRALSMERRLEARIGPLLVSAWPRGVHRALGYRTREAYARERLGMDPTRARSLVRLERAVVESELLARAYRTGALSPVRASVVAPLVSADPLGRFVGDWVAWAKRVTVRRLREDVEWAITLKETDPEAFRRNGGLPPEARDDREIGATEKVREGYPSETEPGSGLRDDLGIGNDREIGATEKLEETHLEAAGARLGAPQTASAQDEAGPNREIGAAEKVEETHLEAAGARLGAPRTASAKNEAGPNREIGATEKGAREHMVRFGLNSDPWPHHHPEPLKSAPEETCWARFIGPADVVQLFRALLCTVRRRMERDTGRLPTEGQALGAMLDHVLSTWGAMDGKAVARHRVFARDGWRCTVPGCTSMQNLHDHHIRFRSAQGSDDLKNRTTLCAFHHLRGVHKGLLRCVGRAPDGLRWEMGIRPGVTPRLVYRSGDIRVPARAPSAL